MSSAETFLAEKAKKTETALEAYIASWGGVPHTLEKAIRYSLFAGGKRLRPALALGAAELVSGDDAVALPLACALEMIHTYSLIHDDLPAMDDDDLRRGKPTSHKVHGEAVAILAGDGLLTMAFDIAATSNNSVIIAEIARAAGVSGMVGGQLSDIESEGKSVDLDTLQGIHRAKTGALIRAAVRCGAILAGATQDELCALTQFGEDIGLAFQITDDILDVAGNEEALGKPIGSDKGKAKATYPDLLGLDEARRLAEETSDSAVSRLARFGAEADAFRAIANYIVQRDH